MGKLDRKVVIVTGAARGIGRAVAIGLAAEGATIGLVDCDAPELADACRAVEECGGVVATACADVSSEDSVRDGFAVLAGELGPAEILVNNAGRAASCEVLTMSLSEWQQTLAVDLTSVFLCTREVLPEMTRRGRGRIINIGSQLGLCGAAGAAHYSAAKAGVHAFTKSLALEVAHQGITVNAIAPGPIETRMLWDADPAAIEHLRQQIPLGRFAQPEDVVPTVVLLASDDGAYYTGAVLNMSGGQVTG